MALNTQNNAYVNFQLKIAKSLVRRKNIEWIKFLAQHSYKKNML